MLRLVSLLSKFKRFRVAGWVAGRVAGKAENIDQLSPAKLEFGLGLSLARNPMLVFSSPYTTHWIVRV